MRRLLTSTAALFLAATGCGDPSAKRPLRVGYHANPPYLFRGDDGTPRGVVVDVLNAAAARRGESLVWTFSPEGPDESLRRGSIDLWPFTVATPERRTRYFVSESWLTTRALIVSRRGVPLPADLAGMRLGVPHSSFFRQLASSRYPEAIVATSSSRERMFEAFCAGTHDALLIDERALSTLLLDRTYCTGLALRANAVPGSDQELALTGDRRQRRRIESLRAGIDDLAHAGLIRPIFQRWSAGAWSPETELLSNLEETRRRGYALGLLAIFFAAAFAALGLLAWRLRRARAEAERAAAARSHFLANLSHEIRTPINGVLGLTELLQQTRMDPVQRDLAASIQLCGRNILALVSDILDLSKLDAARMELEVIDFDLTETARTLSAAFTPAAHAKGLQLHIHPVPADCRWLRGDPVRITQILMNFTANAVKFTASGSVDVRVRRLDHRLRFEVSDTGIGIDEPTRLRLFQPFTQADASTTRKFGGTGLGLAIARRIVECMGGEIGVESTPASGSTFWCVLPVAPGEPYVEPATPHHETRPLQVLVAEDNKVNQAVAAGLLKQLGHAARIADNGEIALDLFARERFDAVLMDCQMPVLDGYQATRRIRQMDHGRAVPIIALTAHALASDRHRCLAAGMNDYLAKPVTLEQLRGALSRAALLAPVAAAENTKRALFERPLAPINPQSAES